MALNAVFVATPSKAENCATNPAQNTVCLAATLKPALVLFGMAHGVVRLDTMATTVIIPAQMLVLGPTTTHVTTMVTAWLVRKANMVPNALQAAPLPVWTHAIETERAHVSLVIMV
jgi:NAD-dependent SIR2 family protein deacetylase